MEIEKLELSNIGKNMDEERAGVVAKKVVDELLLQVGTVSMSLFFI